MKVTLDLLHELTQWTLDLLSIPNYVIKKGRLHGNRHGKTDEQRKHFIAHNLRKRCIKKGFEGITTAFKTTQQFLNRCSALIELHPDGQRRAERFHLSNDGR